MAGLALALGSARRDEVENMMRRMAHRGPTISALHESGKVVLGQCYLPADTAGGDGGLEIPVRSADNPSLMILYDGQMGDWARLAREHDVADGPFREERLLLALYRRYGRAMLDHLTDAIFSFVIVDGGDVFAARDLLGIKTLFYGWKGDTLYLASELKGVLAATGDVHEFPNGHYMDESGTFTRFATLPASQPGEWPHGVDEMCAAIRDIIERGIQARVDFAWPTGGLLSGGMDSSVINYLASKAYRARFGEEARLKTFSLGVGESEDIRAARTMADYIGSEHHELICDLPQLLEVLPQVIYHLESFDPSLVRSSASNYLISRYAREQGIEVLLSGEGGDEVFCGYLYLARCPAEELFARQMECIGFLHSNASLRLDRMNQCHSIRVVAPLVSGELLWYAMSIPPQYKQMPQGEGKIEKWIFRKAYEGLLPPSIVWRTKQEFSQGSGSASVLPAYFEERISDQELAQAQAAHPVIRSKEELHYFRLFTEYFGTGSAVDTVGQWVSL